MNTKSGDLKEHHSTHGAQFKQIQYKSKMNFTERKTMNQNRNPVL